MVRPKKEIKRIPLSIRLREELVNESLNIPKFRKELEKKAEALFVEWKINKIASDLSNIDASTETMATLKNILDELKDIKDLLKKNKSQE